MNLSPFPVSHNSLINPEEFFDEFFDSFLVKKTFSFNINPDSFKVDIYNKDNQYIFKAELPGFNKEDITIEYLYDFLVISVESTAPRDITVLQQERKYGTLRRMFYVNNVQENTMDIKYNQGILEITLAKKA